MRCDWTCCLSCFSDSALCDRTKSRRTKHAPLQLARSIKLRISVAIVPMSFGYRWAIMTAQSHANDDAEASANVYCASTNVWHLLMYRAGPFLDRDYYSDGNSTTGISWRFISGCYCCYRCWQYCFCRYHSGLCILVWTTHSKGAPGDHRNHEAIPNQAQARPVELLSASTNVLAESQASQHNLKPYILPQLVLPEPDNAYRASSRSADLDVSDDPRSMYRAYSKPTHLGMLWPDSHAQPTAQQHLSPPEELHMQTDLWPQSGTREFSR
ncbi:hypothetical protein NA56DRAFT_713312 [Hyaloscypha hepaticicola]|uniref:Uncharacterized protein n=1 Tax=Hyaloscypha hepaticicola TaxID=2082293 RepID=A0A2J6PE69_9HELO|nr:hypothetical protein NA56DRAFT_713312 [Hyaloscypha hepaticicola]